MKFLPTYLLTSGFMDMKISDGRHFSSAVIWAALNR